MKKKKLTIQNLADYSYILKLVEIRFETFFNKMNKDRLFGGSIFAKPKCFEYYCQGFVDGVIYLGEHSEHKDKLKEILK